MIGTIFSAFNLLGLASRIGIIVALGLSLLTAYGVWHHKVYTKGYNSALAAIAKQDDFAITRAKEMRRGFKTCRDQGKNWDQTTGACT